MDVRIRCEQSKKRQRILIDGHKLKHALGSKSAGPEWSWGHVGFGPAHTALSIMVMLTTPAKAYRHYNAFERDFVAVWPQHLPEFEVIIDFDEWLRSQEPEPIGADHGE